RAAPTHLALAGRPYWIIDQLSVMFAAEDGGVEVAYTGSRTDATSWPKDLAAGGGGVFWTTPTKMSGCLAAGASCSPIDLSQGAGDSLWYQGGVLYDAAGMRVFWCAPSACQPAAITFGTSEIESIVVDDTNIYATFSDRIAAVCKDGGGARTIALEHASVT